MRWAHDHPEEMAEIAALPPSQQNEALRNAMGPDPRSIRRCPHCDLAYDVDWNDFCPGCNR